MYYLSIVSVHVHLLHVLFYDSSGIQLNVDLIMGGRDGQKGKSL